MDQCESHGGKGRRERWKAEEKVTGMFWVNFPEVGSWCGVPSEPAYMPIFRGLK